MACVLMSGGCGDKEHMPDRADVLLEIGDSMLRKSDVVARIPVGLSPADSAALFRTIVRTWVEEMLLCDMAEERIGNLDEIESKVADYRRKLIVASYLQTVRDNGRRTSDSESVRRYFEAHRSEMHLEAPAVKGIYVKMPSGAERVDDVRRWVKSATDASVDNLEKYGLAQALQYDYFKDKWIDWQTIAEEIPYRFSDPEAFLSGLLPAESVASESNKKAERKAAKGGYFETENGGAVYMLHISGWLPSGSEMPYDLAASRITPMLEDREAAATEQRLVRSLYQKAKKEKRLRIVSFDPGLDKN